jgi:pyruvate,water dikinase
VAFVAGLDRFLTRWGFRGPNEWELRSETWGTRPAIVLAALATMRLADDDASPEAGEAARAAEREAATAAILEALGDDEAAKAALGANLHVAHLFSRARERGRMTVAMLVHEQRLAARELGRRFAERGLLGDPRLVYMLTRAELVGHVVDGAPLPGDLPEREAAYLDLWDRIPPFVVAGEAPPLDQWERRSAARQVAPLAVGEVLTGMSGSPGTVTGTARVVSDPSDPFAIEEGDVMVVPITDPAWTPLFLAAGGVVSDVGAPVSHAAIVSRELGIPCVVSATGASARITDGMVLEIDGTSGTVRRVA